MMASESSDEVVQLVFGAGGAMGLVSDSQANWNHQSAPAEAQQAVEEGDASETMEGVASVALLPSGAISGHFIRLPDSICYGLQGTPISCERECSRGEDYRLLKLTIIDFKSKREKVLVVECRGHDAARLQNIDHLHGWEDDIVGLVEKEHGNQKVLLSFECETLKADKDAEDHIIKYMPNLRGLDAVVNVGKMCITGINLSEDDEPRGDN
ncbi:hypothetical protein GQ55_9G537300 [Panicum hallii var. hallii]|uniref:Uncharacterized protein n=1 Tax=Panicum hallii var. hallii TaxID=1504633 RepID=A0A2T7CEU9_9POAL|nr:hypothetical protein GQ55_9G537300 [Panicum hallii var. hallii]